MTKIQLVVTTDSDNKVRTLPEGGRLLQQH